MSATCATGCESVDADLCVSGRIRTPHLLIQALKQTHTSALLDTATGPWMERVEGANCAARSLFELYASEVATWPPAARTKAVHAASAHGIDLMVAYEIVERAAAGPKEMIATAPQKVARMAAAV